MKTLIHRFRPLYHLFAYNLVQRFRLNRRAETLVGGFDLTIEPGVLHPGVFKSGKVFAELLARADIHGKSVLDLGTGSGILALAAARAGARVTATDNNPRAVACAIENVRRNGFSSSVTVLEGDLFEATAGLVFDIILFNPPYLKGSADGPYSHALYVGDDLGLLRRFAREAPKQLRPKGTVLMILSSDAPVDSVCGIFDELGYSREILRRQKNLFEEFIISKFTPIHSSRIQ